MAATMTNHLLLLLAAIVLLRMSNGLDIELGESGDEVRFPAEHERHERTFMVFPGSSDVWDDEEKEIRLLNRVQEEIVAIAEAIVKFEPVTLIVSPNDYTKATKMTSPKIDILKLPVDDLWARDTIPVFTSQTAKNEDRYGRTVKSKPVVVGVDFNFNGWGGKQTNRADSLLAQRLLWTLNIRRRNTTLVAEGGSLETDGAGTLLVTRSSVINKNRNPGKDEKAIEKELKSVLGVKNIIWFNGVKGKDITDAHVDSIVRFVRPGRVIISRPCQECEGKDDDDIWIKAATEALDILKKETDASGRKFEIVNLYEPDPDKIKVVGDRDKFVSTYVNFYVANGAVIMPKFGDWKADIEAQRVLKTEFPGRKIVALEITALASGGGGIHCATHELPASGSEKIAPAWVASLLALFAMYV